MEKKTIIKKIGLIVALVILVFALPALGFFVGIGAIWYYAKKQPNKRYRNYSIFVALLSMMVLSATDDTASETKQPDESIVVSESVESREQEDAAQKEEELKAEAESKAAKEKAEKEKKKKAEAESKEKVESASIAKAESESKAESVAKAESEKAASVAQQEAEIEEERVELQSSTPYLPDGATYVEVNGNVPLFTNADLSSTEAWEDYGDLDYLGRVTVANAVLGVELMPAEQRGDISSILPSGWNQAEYSVVPAGWLYNRSHLIGFQLTGENANEQNLMTGTRWFNTEGMLPFENFVANYIESTENHVRYRITPYFEGENLVASGIFMEGMSIEDNGDDLMFHIYVPNIQPGVNIDYSTGYSWVDSPVVETPQPAPAPPPVVETPAPAPPPVVETPAPTPPSVVETPQTEVYYKNCTAAREAGAAPVYRGEPGYAKHLDRDNDGIGCE